MAGERHPILTIGYEGASPAEVLAALAAAQVRTLIDVRDRPWSRKPGFSKSTLPAAVEAAGIAYVHLGALGTPKPGREAARAGRRAEFERILAARLDSAEGARALAAAALIAAQEGPACLMCFEADPERCHRTIVAALLGERLGAPIRHLRAAPRLP